MRKTPVHGRRGLKSTVVAVACVLSLSSGFAVSAQEASPIAPATATQTATPEATATNDAAESEVASATPEASTEGSSIDANDGFVIPNSSEGGLFWTVANFFWKIVNQLGMVFLRGPLSSTIFNLDNQGPYEDPRAPQTITPATIDLNGKIPDPTWFKNNAELQAAGAKYISAYSTAMERDIPLVWVPAPDQSSPRPVVYALDGIGGGVYGSYLIGTDLIDRAREINVNLLMPAQGANSNYLDWYDDSNVESGKQQWETFLTKELPDPLDTAIGANGQRSIVGMSMSGGSVFILAEHNPGLYDAVGGISGCGESSSFLTRNLQQAVLRDLGTVEELYGPANGEFNRYNDSLVNARALEGTKLIYNFNAGGLLGVQDLDPNYAPESTKEWGARILNGAVIEWATGSCAHRLEAALNSAGIPATFEYASSGAHNWGVFTQGSNRFMELLGERVYPATAE